MFCYPRIWSHVYTTLRFLFIQCLRSYLHYVGKHAYTGFGETFTPYLKKFLYHPFRHVYSMFEGMLTQCLYKRVQNVSNDPKWLIIEQIRSNDLKWIKMVIMGKKYLK